MVSYTSKKVVFVISLLRSSQYTLCAWEASTIYVRIWYVIETWVVTITYCTYIQYILHSCTYIRMYVCTSSNYALKRPEWPGTYIGHYVVGLIHISPIRNCILKQCSNIICLHQGDNDKMEHTCINCHLLECMFLLFPDEVDVHCWSVGIQFLIWLVWINTIPWSNYTISICTHVDHNSTATEGAHSPAEAIHSTLQTEARSQSSWAGRQQTVEPLFGSWGPECGQPGCQESVDAVCADCWQEDAWSWSSIGQAWGTYRV